MRIGKFIPFYSFFIFFLFSLVYAHLDEITQNGLHFSDNSIEKNCNCTEMEIFDEIIHSGTFKSLGFPNYYCGSLNCQWHIVPVENSFVSAKIEHFDTKIIFDQLKIYQTQMNGSNLLKAKQIDLSGKFYHSLSPQHFFSSLDGGLLFHFTTHERGPERDKPGFKISFQRHNKDDPLNFPCPPAFHFATENPQNLPQLAADFPHNSACGFVINSTKAIKLSLNNFEKYNLGIKVYETENLAASNLYADELVSFPIAMNKLPFSLISRTSSLTILIQKGNFYFADRKSNFTFDIKFQQSTAAQICQCFPSELSINNSMPLAFLSPGYPIEYCDNLDCPTIISLNNSLAPNNYSTKAIDVFRIRFNNFSLISSDYFFIYGVVQSDQGKLALASKSLIRRTNNLNSLTQFTLDSQQIGLKFKTDNSIVGQGFNLTIEAYRKEEECICPNALENLLEGQNYTEFFQFDARKCKSMDCFWQIKAPNTPMKRLLLWLNYTLGEENEKLIIYEDWESLSNIDNYNHFNEDDFENKISVEHYLDLKIRPYYQPLTIWYHREWPDSAPVPKENSKREISFFYDWRKECECGPEELNASIEHWQPLHSPGYPELYCASMYCKWLLNAPQGHHLILNISKFATEYSDELFIADGNERDLFGEHAKRFSGQLNFTTQLNSTKNQMTLMFYSDYRIQLEGFEIWFKAVPMPINENYSTDFVASFERIEMPRNNIDENSEQIIAQIEPVEDSNNNDNIWIFLFLFPILLLGLSIPFILLLASKSNGIQALWPPSRIFRRNWGNVEILDEGRVYFIRNPSQSTIATLGSNNYSNED